MPILKLYPPSLVQAIMGATEQAVAQFADRQVLLVRVDDVEGKLASGLKVSAHNSGFTFDDEAPSSSRLSLFDKEETGTRVSPLVQPGAKGAAPKPLPRRSRTSPQFGAALLEKQLLTAPHFGLPLSKRDADWDPARRFALTLDRKIRVGRSKGSDIVLNHSTVSTSHALIDADQDEVFFLVMDSGSTNGTRLNGEKLVPKKSVGVYPGDVIHFGDVETMLCPIGALRTVLVRTALT